MDFFGSLRGRISTYFLVSLCSGLNGLIAHQNVVRKYRVDFTAQKIVEKGRRAFSREIRRVFKYQVVQSFGGWVVRLPEGVSQYRAVIFTTSNCVTGIREDNSFVPLWKFISNVLKVPLMDIHILEVPNEGPWMDYFTVIRQADEPEDWSHYDGNEISDDESVISIHEDSEFENVDFFLN